MIKEPQKLKSGSVVRILGNKLRVEQAGLQHVFFEGGIRVLHGSSFWETAEIVHPPLPQTLGGDINHNSLFVLNEDGNYDPAYVGERPAFGGSNRVIFNRPAYALLEDLRTAVEQLEDALDA